MGNTLTAPRCRIMLDGKIIGRGTDVTVNTTTEVQDVDCIDSIETIEYAPLSYKVSGTIGLVGTKGSTVKSLGMFPKTGKDANEHLLNILLHGESVLVLMDKATPARNLMTINRVIFTDHGWSVSARQIVGINVTWRAIRETDEFEAST